MSLLYKYIMYVYTAMAHHSLGEGTIHLYAANRRTVSLLHKIISMRTTYIAASGTPPKATLGPNADEEML